MVILCLSRAKHMPTGTRLRRLQGVSLKSRRNTPPPPANDENKAPGTRCAKGFRPGRISEGRGCGSSGKGSGHCCVQTKAPSLSAQWGCPGRGTRASVSFNFRRNLFFKVTPVLELKLGSWMC